MQYSKFVTKSAVLLLLAGAGDIFCAAMQKEDIDKFYRQARALESELSSYILYLKSLKNNGIEQKAKEKSVDEHQGPKEDLACDISDCITKFRVFLKFTFSDYMAKLEESDDNYEYLKLKELIAFNNLVMDSYKKINKIKEEVCRLDHSIWLYDFTFDDVSLNDQIPEFVFKGNSKRIKTLRQIASNFFNVSILKNMKVIEKFAQVATSEPKIDYAVLFGLKEELNNILEKLFLKIDKTFSVLGEIDSDTEEEKYEDCDEIADQKKR